MQIFCFLVIAILKFEIIFVFFTIVPGHQNHYHLLSPNCSSLIIHLNLNSSIFLLCIARVFNKIADLFILSYTTQIFWHYSVLINRHSEWCGWFTLIRKWWPTRCNFLVHLFVPNQLYIFRTTFSTIIRSTWLYLQLLI